ncbi:MAG: methyltransferase domain-containing protein [Deltaproteobacteria bacterium]
MDIRKIDWNEAWKKAHAEGSRKWKDPGFWNRRAPSFAKHAAESPYASDFIGIMQPEQHWSVLDVGCGAGTLARPLSKMVKQITAIDSSDVMITLLQEQCAKEGLLNVTALNIGWEEDWEKAGVGIHDVTIASRSLIVEDLKEALNKLNRFARKRVYISALVGDGPFDRRIFEAIGLEIDRRPDYIYIYNLLYQMGIYADVTFVTNQGHGKVYSDLEAAVQDLRWMIDELNSEKEVLLREYLRRNLIKKEGGWGLPHQHVVRWAIISWSIS